jgi:hypothetical protein
MNHVMLKAIIVFCLVITTTGNIYSEVPKTEKSSGSKLSFTENKGQFADQDYNPRPDVLFGGSDGQITFHITVKGISYQLYRVDKYKDAEDSKAKELRKEIELQTIYRTDIKWLKANLNPLVKTDEALPGVNNYYLEQCPDGALNIKSYTGITLEDIYNDIDLHYYEKNGQLKHDYIVAPHADYKQIQLKVEGAKLHLQKDGSLLIETPLGKIQEQAPLVYQNGKQLKARYAIHNNIISFEIEHYNPNHELIIDPVTRFWGTYYGGTATDYGYSCATDASGNVYMSGRTSSNTGMVIATAGSHQSAFGGGSADAILVKFNGSGVRQWGTYYGGTGVEYGWGCATDASGNVYMTGYTSSNTGIATGGSHQSAYGGGSIDAFLVKFNSSGVRQWGSYYGGTGDDRGWSCATDASGNVYMSGYTSSDIGTIIATAGSHQSAYGGGIYNAFLVKFNSSGVRQWGSYYGGTLADFGYGCATDTSGNVYLTGVAHSNNGTVIATSGSHQSTTVGADAFLVKFNSSGVRQWGTYYGGTGSDEGYSCAIDVSGNVYMAGSTSTNTGTVIATTGSHQSALGGNNDAFLVKFNSSGVRQWGTYYGGTGDDFDYSCAIDPSGNVYLAGWTNSNTGTAIATTGSYQSAHGGGTYDAFLVKFNSSGIRQWGSYYGGTGDDFEPHCAIDATGNLYMAGFTTSNTGTAIASAGSHQSAIGGTNDAFLVKFADCNLLSQPSAVSGATSLCTGAPAQSYSVSNDPLATFYTWTLPGGWSGSSPTSTITTTVSSTGIITVTAKDACSSSPPRTLAVTVYPLPTITVNSGSICSGSSFTISPGGANTFTIQGGNNVVSPLANASYTVTGTSIAGCVSASSATSNLIVHATPTITANSGSICSGSSFTIYPAGANTYTIQGGNNVVSPTTNVSYTVTGTNTAGCVSASSATSIVNVNPLPTVGLSTSNTLICEGESATLTASGASNYTFNPGGPGANIIINPTVTSTYTVSGADANGCSNSTTITQSVGICAAISAKGSLDEGITIYPNPTNGILTIQSPALVQKKVEVYNSIGQSILSFELQTTDCELNLSVLPNGIYFVKIGTASKKIIKE